MVRCFPHALLIRLHLLLLWHCNKRGRCESISRTERDRLKVATSEQGCTASTIGWLDCWTHHLLELSLGVGLGRVELAICDWSFAEPWSIFFFIFILLSKLVFWRLDRYYSIMLVILILRLVLLNLACKFVDVWWATGSCGGEILDAFGLTALVQVPDQLLLHPRM